MCRARQSQSTCPRLPATGEPRSHRIETGGEACLADRPRLGRCFAEPDRKQAARLGQLTHEGHDAGSGQAIGPGHRLIAAEVSPAVGVGDETSAAAAEWRRCGHADAAGSGRREHGVVGRVEPGDIVRAEGWPLIFRRGTIDAQMRRQQRIQPHARAGHRIGDQ